MRSKEDIRPISYIKSHTADILNQINNTQRPIYITQNGEARGVIIDTESYENMRNALGILKLISQGETNIENNNLIEQSKVFESIENKYFNNVKK
ncbi:MAG: type II toxin-antitoxin system Phd/YefM family antitoxin [Spirochaetia bacterium]|nr:type II toxin-antitoxin system Phd/YefM family antitoxin [Spirochaetia bacterium]